MLPYSTKMQVKMQVKNRPTRKNSERGGRALTERLTKIN